MTSMKMHQKCFSLRDCKSGKLANRFILVSNLEAEDGGKAIVAGNERVIRARLSDAKFFWRNDLGRPLERLTELLGQVTFHEKLGTQLERVGRIKRLARELAPPVGADPDDAERAAHLAKADLMSETVGEFPELQGIIGRYIALAQGEKPAVADAIAEHYKPQGQRMPSRRTRFPSRWRLPTSSTCWSGSGPSTRSRPARKTPSRCAAPPLASSASFWRINPKLPASFVDCGTRWSFSIP